MQIDHYSFGKIRIDGVEYHDDVIITRNGVIAPWWRRAGGHVFSPDDLTRVFDAHPQSVVLGTGSIGMVNVPPAAMEAFEKRGIKVVRARTAKAVEKFNQLVQQGEDVVAAIHLTC